MSLTIVIDLSALPYPSATLGAQGGATPAPATTAPPAPATTSVPSVPAPRATAISTTPPASPPCQFVLGFRALHDLIPQVVGACLDDEAHAANGDALQYTAKGLLVWRKADDFTAFTDGYRTWVNGPKGLQERLNAQRFAWEANPEGLPVVP